MDLVDSGILNISKHYVCCVYIHVYVQCLCVHAHARVCVCGCVLTNSVKEGAVALALLKKALLP